MLVRGGVFFGRTANRAASLAHVPRAVHRHRVILSGTAKSISGFFTRTKAVVGTRLSATDIADFLAGSRLVDKRVQKNCFRISVGDLFVYKSPKFRGHGKLKLILDEWAIRK